LRVTQAPREERGESLLQVRKEARGVTALIGVGQTRVARTEKYWIGRGRPDQQLAPLVAMVNFARRGNAHFIGAAGKSVPEIKPVLFG
jgi:hypothetical protein